MVTYQTAGNPGASYQYHTIGGGRGAEGGERGAGQHCTIHSIRFRVYGSGREVQGIGEYVVQELELPVRREKGTSYTGIVQGLYDCIPFPQRKHQ